MSYLEIIIPFILPAPALANDLIKQVKAPALAQLLAWSNTLNHHEFDAFARLLPHQRLLYHPELNGFLTAFNTQAMNQSTHDTNHAEKSLSPKQLRDVEAERLSSLPVTHLHMQALGLNCDEGYWLELSPCHIHVAMDHLVLMEPSRLQIDEAQAKTLFDIAQSLVKELGFELVYGTATQWFIRADEWHDMYTASLEACSGHPMTIWLAQGTHARAWRKLQNEIQMAWHDHELNQEREAQAKKAINTVWLHGGSNRQISDANMAQACPDFATWQTQKLRRVLLNQLSESAINEDWGTWLQQLEHLEQTWFVPLLAAFKAGKIKEVKFILSDEQRLHELKLTSLARWKVWRKANLQALQTTFNLKGQA
jgi:hypothetical protein